MPEATQPQTGILGAFGSSGSMHYSSRIDGTIGSFETPAGVVAFMQTKARVAGPPSPYTELTRALVPAREALPVSEMNFNQLLQRDLDDHRIATKLIPYILTPKVLNLPGFFPPILAVVLPFSDNKPTDYFPAPSEGLMTDPEYSASFRATSFGRSYRIQRLALESGEPALMPFGVLRWNPDAAKLVIVDGQHRAMALLAVERTVNSSWHLATNGARYEPFYREQVSRLLKDAEASGQPVDVAKIELPVTVCWFPEAPGVRGPKPHLSARKLFVDVNNTARPPSESRLVLLSDTELLNILSRELLNRLRTDHEWKGVFPLYAIEYDNPNKANTTPRRWSVITNLEILKNAVLRIVFGPPTLVKSMQHSLTVGRPNWREMNEFMRTQLRVDMLFAKDFHDGPRPMKREALGNDNFPMEDEGQKKLLDEFYERWGKGLLHLLCRLEPWSMHLRALSERFTSWTPGDNVQTLAKDALFEGVGMFWTLEDGHELWQQQRQEARVAKSPEPAQSDVSRAWTILAVEQAALFARRRSLLYLGSDDDATVRTCNDLFKSLNTYAAQVGLALAWVSIHASSPSVDPLGLAKLIVSVLNDTLTTGPSGGRNRKLVLLNANYSGAKKPFNCLPKLDTPFASYFRYFWLELLFLERNDDVLSAGGVDVTKGRVLRDSARKWYLDLLVAERAKIRRSDDDLRDKSLKEQEETSIKRARIAIVDEQADAYKYWFGIPKPEAKARLEATLGADSNQAEEATGDISNGAPMGEPVTEELSEVPADTSEDV